MQLSGALKYKSYSAEPFLTVSYSYSASHDKQDQNSDTSSGTSSALACVSFVGSHACACAQLCECPPALVALTSSAIEFAIIDDTLA